MGVGHCGLESKKGDRAGETPPRGGTAEVGQSKAITGRISDPSAYP